MNSILGIKFRMALFGLKSVCDSRDDAIVRAIMKDSEFEDLIKTLEKVCAEASTDRKLKQGFHSLIVRIKEFHGTKKVEDLFRDQKFEQAVSALEEIYIEIYEKTGEYDSEYQHFSKEIKRIADSQPDERKTSSVNMWIKGIIGVAIAAAATTTYYLKKRKKEKTEK